MAENQNSPPYQHGPSQTGAHHGTNNGGAMPQTTPEPTETHTGEPAKPARSGRGFAAMDPERQREIARKGGRSVPDEKRSFSQNRELAAAAGRKGGQESGGNFANDRARAAAAGRKGGQH
jgi:general stress protein YciG